MKQHWYSRGRSVRWVLLLLCLSLLTACAHEGSVATSADSSTTEPPVQTEASIVAAENGVSRFALIRSKDANDNISLLADEFQAEWEKRTGAAVELLKDSKDAGQLAELLIGDTNRAESQALRDALTAAGGDRYGILVSDQNIAVLGTNTWLTYLGLCRVLDSLSTSESGQVQLALQPNTTWVSDGSDAGMPDIAESVACGVPLVFRIAEKVAEVPGQDGGYRSMQGGGTDGQYAYYGMINGETDSAYLFKFEIATWTLVAQSELLPLYHSNDITYDAVNHRLVISSCTEKHNWKGICTVDPDTLEVLEFFRVEASNRAVEYLPEQNEYLLGENFGFYRTDANFQILEKMECYNKEYITQGMCCDGRYFYDVRYNTVDSKSRTHYIVVQDLNGGDYGAIPLMKTSMEPENMFRLGSDFFVGFNGNTFQFDPVYRVELLPETFW